MVEERVFKVQDVKGKTRLVRAKGSYAAKRHVESKYHVRVKWYKEVSAEDLAKDTLSTVTKKDVTKAVTDSLKDKRFAKAYQPPKPLGPQPPPIVPEDGLKMVRDFRAQSGLTLRQIRAACDYFIDKD